jgi:hypothetical protein
MKILSIRRDREQRAWRAPKSIVATIVAALWLASMPTVDPVQAASKSPPISLATSPDIIDWLTVGALWLTACGVLVAMGQIWFSRTAAKIERTRAFQERYQADGFRESASRTIGCAEARDAGDCVKFIRAWSTRPDAMERVLPQPEGNVKASVQDIERTLTLFEEMGTAHKLKQLHEKTINMSIAPVVVQVFATAWWLICWLREGHLSNEGNAAGDVYLEFEGMCAAIRKDLPTMMADMDLEPVAAIRALCLPHGCDRENLGDGTTWSASHSLSLSLSAFIRRPDSGKSLSSRLDDLAAQVEELHPRPKSTEGGVPEKWDVILVPATIDQPCDDEWRGQCSASVRLASALDRCAEQDVLDAAVAHVAGVAGG